MVYATFHAYGVYILYVYVYISTYYILRKSQEITMPRRRNHFRDSPWIWYYKSRKYSSSSSVHHISDRARAVSIIPCYESPIIILVIWGIYVQTMNCHMHLRGKSHEDVRKGTCCLKNNFGLYYYSIIMYDYDTIMRYIFFNYLLFFFLLQIDLYSNGGHAATDEEDVSYVITLMIGFRDSLTGSFISKQLTQFQ